MDSATLKFLLDMAGLGLFVGLIYSVKSLINAKEWGEASFRAFVALLALFMMHD